MARPEPVQALYRSCFPAFAKFAFRELHPEARLIDSWHLDCTD